MSNYRTEQRTTVIIWTHEIAQTGKPMNRLRDDFRQRLGQEATPKRSSVQWKRNSLQQVTENISQELEGHQP